MMKRRGLSTMILFFTMQTSSFQRKISEEEGADWVVEFSKCITLDTGLNVLK